ncbi:MAG: glycosyltransferase family 2 protein [Heteroscytonema crispum UTEX LB 1556]
MPKVSVIIPAYNAMTYLPETLQSVLRQNFTDFEVLIIDDGSSDNIQEWGASQTDPRMKLISQTNQGQSAARNLGIALAKGEYIAFLDADDLWEPTMLEKQVRCLEENPAVGLAYHWTALIDENGKATGRVMGSNASGDVLKQILERNIIDCPSVVIRRCCFENVGLFIPNLRFIEDWEMWIRIASGYHFAVTQEPLVYYRQHSKNTSKNWQLMEEGYRIVIEKAFQSVPPDLLCIKNRSYGRANLCLAWKALQSKDKDYKLAQNFRAKAIAYYPQLRFSREYMRLSLAIALMRYFGSNGYSKVLELAYTLRRSIWDVAR